MGEIERIFREEGEGLLGRARARWDRVDPHTRAVLAIAVGFVVFRTWLATQSAFGFHRGWNEGHYALVASGFLQDPLVPRHADSYVYNVPPLFPYLVAGGFAILGESTLAARLPSVLAAGGAIVATYWLGVAVYDDRRVAALGAGLFATLPYVQLYGGRAQTDMLMLFLVTASLACIIRGYERSRGNRWLVAGGVLFAAGFAAKQPALALPGIVLGWLVANRRFDTGTLRRTGVLIGASAVALIPLAAWFYLNYLRAPSAFVETWELELFGRTEPFASLETLVVIGFPLGLSPLVLGLAGSELVATARARVRQIGSNRDRIAGPSVLGWWIVLYGVFVLYRTPRGHLYYVLVLAPPVALLTARRLTVLATLPAVGTSELLSVGAGLDPGRVLVVIVLLSSLGGTGVLYELSGEFSVVDGGGDRTASATGQYLADTAPENATVIAPIQFTPPVQWYGRSGVPPENVRAYSVTDLSEDELERERDRTVGPVYVVYPDPSWGAPPASLSEPVYRSPTYEYGIMSLAGRYVTRSDKYGYYLNDRAVVVYRLD